MDVYQKNPFNIDEYFFSELLFLKNLHWKFYCCFEILFEKR